MRRTILAGLTIGIGLGIGLGCSPAATPRDLGLDYDHPVGWQRRILFAPGEATRKRSEASYLDLQYASLDDEELSRRVILSDGKLADRSLIARPEDLCHPNFIAAVRAAAPERLLLQIQGDFSAAHMKCVEQLGVERLYLGLCPDDGASIWPCDGDAQLATLGAASTLHPRIRGLAVGAGERASLRHLDGLVNLEYLVLRGPMLDDVDEADSARLCAFEHLRYFDSLDATRAGSVLIPPLSCALRLQTFIAPQLTRRDDWSIPPLPPLPPADTSSPCRLRRIVVWQLNKNDRLALKPCADLSERQEIDPSAP